MQKVKKIIASTMIFVALAVFCIEGGIQILPFQLGAVLLMGVGMALLGFFKKEDAND